MWSVRMLISSTYLEVLQNWFISYYTYYKFYNIMYKVSKTQNILEL